MPDSLRTFFAVEIDKQARERAGDWIRKLAAVNADVKWVASENLHWTLKFLGDVPAVDTPRIIEAVSQAVAGFGTFDLELRGLGAFPNARRPQTIWVGAGQGTDKMTDLHGRVDTALKKLHFRPEERRFVPHLTLGRLRSFNAPLAELSQLLAQNANTSIAVSPATEVVLFASYLDRTGPTYQALGRAKLA